MSGHHDFPEDGPECETVGIFFVCVVVVLFLIGIL